MTKQDLIDGIEERMVLLQNIQGCREEISRANAQLEALGTEEPFLGFIRLGIGCFGGILGFFVGLMFSGPIYDMSKGPAGMMIVFISMFCGYKIFSSIVKGFVRRANDKESAKWQKHHDHYEQELQLIIDKYGDWITKILPAEYAYASCANKLLAYLKNGRADSLKEALNLYEMELGQMQVQQLQEQVGQLQSDVAYAAQKAADAEAAIDSARFWGTRL